MARKTANPFGWAFVGAGSIAGQVASQLRKSKNHRIVSVYNRTFSKAEAFAEKYRCTPCQTLEEAVNRPDVEGVYNCTIHNTHYELAKRCLELGKPVLIEKPITVTRKEAEELADLALSKNLYIAEAMWTWFNPTANQVKAWLDEGKIGILTDARFNYALPAARGYPRLLDPNQAGGALLDSGIYPVTYAYRLFGMPDRVECTGELDGGVDLKEDILFHYNSGLDVPIHISIVDGKGGFERLELNGTYGSIRHPFFHMWNRATLTVDGHKTRFHGKGGYLPEFDTVAAEIRAGKLVSDMVPIHFTLAVLSILDDCRAQMNLVYPFEQ